MNTKQKRVIFIGFLIIVIMGLFPPWNHKIYTSRRVIETYAGYGFIFYPPSLKGEDGIAKIDSIRLLFQWILATIITVGLTVICKDEKGIFDFKKLKEWLIPKK